MKIVKEAMHRNEDSAEKYQKSAQCNSHLSNDWASEDVMTSYVQIIIRKKVKYADNLDVLNVVR